MVQVPESKVLEILGAQVVHVKLLQEQALELMKHKCPECTLEHVGDKQDGTEDDR